MISPDPSLRLRRFAASNPGSIRHVRSPRKAPIFGWVFFVVNHTSQMWNTLYPALANLSSKLERLMTVSRYVATSYGQI
jgi:hypothetical protein